MSWITALSIYIAIGSMYQWFVFRKNRDQLQFPLLLSLIVRFCVVVVWPFDLIDQMNLRHGYKS